MITFTFTGIVYLFSFLVFGLLTYRFFQYWQRERNNVSAFLLYFGISFEVVLFVAFIGPLFMAYHPLVLRWAVIISGLILGLSCAFLAYLIFYAKIPKVSPWLGFSLVLSLGILLTVLTFYDYSFQPYLEESGAIDWGYQDPWRLIRASLYLLTWVPIGLIFAQQAKKSKKAEARMKAVGLSIVFLVSGIIAPVDFIIEDWLGLSRMTSDIGLICLSFFLLIFILWTQKTPLPEKKYITTPFLGPEIKW